MPLVYRSVNPKKVSNGKLELKGKTDSEYIAVNNETLVNVLRQLASVVTHAGDIFSDVASLTEQVGKRVRSVKLRLAELEAKADLFDPRLVPVPEGTLDDISKTCLPYHHRLHGDCDGEELMLKTTTNLVHPQNRPRFLIQLYDNAGQHQPQFPPRSPILSSRRSLERQISVDSRRPASFAALRDWKLDDCLDDKIATIGRKKQSAEELNRALASPFPSKVVQVNVTGAGFDRMKANRRSLVVHTKKIRRNKRRNTICGAMPNKECGIQTSFTSVASPAGTDEDGSRGSSSVERRSDENSNRHHHHHHRHSSSNKYGIDSGHWSSSCTSSAQDGVGGGTGAGGTCTSTCSAPSPWDPNSLSTSSDFLFDDEDRCLTPQLENFTDGLVSDSDSVDTDGYFTSFRSDCGFPKMKKSPSTKELEEMIAKDQDIGSLASSAGIFTDSAGEGGSVDGGGKNQGLNGSCSAPSSANNTIIAAPSLQTIKDGVANSQKVAENEYELFGKGSTSTTASSCGTVVLRHKPEPPQRTSSTATIVASSEEQAKGQTCESSCGNDDVQLGERVKRKSLIEPVPCMVVVTPSPSCSSESPPPLKDPGVLKLHLVDDGIECDSELDSAGRLTPKAEDLFTTNESECGTLSDTDSDRRTEVRLSDIAVKKRSTSSTSSTGTASTTNSTLTLTSCAVGAGGGGVGGLPQPDVIPADAVVQQMQIIRTAKTTPRLDTNKEYYSLDTVLLGSFEEEQQRKSQGEGKGATENGTLLTKKEKVKEISCPTPPASVVGGKEVSMNGVATSGKVRGARVVLDANGEIIFSSETLRRKRKQKVSFDPGSAVKSPDYDSNSTYARVRESVYDRIRKEPGEQEKLYECIEEIRRHNLKPRDPFQEAQQLKQEKNGKNLTPMVNGSGTANGERSGSSASISSSVGSSSSPAKSCSSTPDPHNSSGGLLETDLDSAIPPVMPDLKNLPKIKDRLKRNESYRIANTDDIPPPSASPTSSSSVTPTPPATNGTATNPSRSPLSPLHLNRNGLSSLAKRMSLTSPTRHGISSHHRMSSPTPLHLNKKRDIPEEDPNFIQQIFSMNTAANNQLNGSGGTQNGNMSNNHHNHHSLLKSPLDNSNNSSPSSRITLSKFNLSAEDRPSFLRRDSPPTMDEIAKEIYRFRKKFNIQPNASTTTLTRTTGKTPPTTPTSTNSASSLGGGILYGGSLRRVPAPPSGSTRTLPRPSSSIGQYTSPPHITTPPRSSTTSPKSTIPEGFPTLSVQPSSPLSTSTPVRFRSSIATANPASSPIRAGSSASPSPIYYPAPTYGWTTSPPPSIYSQSPYSTSSQSSQRPHNSSTPPIPPVRSAFGTSSVSRKIFPMRPSSIAVSSTTTPSSVHSINNNQYNSATISTSQMPFSTPQHQNYSQPLKPTRPFAPSPNNMHSLYYNTKSASLLPSLPFRRNSVAFAEPVATTSCYSPTPVKPRTSIGEFKRLLQATQKKRSSISAVEVLKPKGLETTL